MEMMEKKPVVSTEDQSGQSFKLPLISSVDLPQPDNKAKKLLVIGLMMILVGSLIAGGLVVSRQALQKRNQAADKPAVVATATPAAAKEISPEPSLDKKELKIKILNGRGEPGAASVAAKLLQGKGYSEEIETGNAKNYDYEQTEIQIKAAKADYFALLVNDLKDEYSVSSKSAELAEDSNFDTVIIIGSEKN